MNKIGKFTVFITAGKLPAFFVVGLRQSTALFASELTLGSTLQALQSDATILASFKS